MRNFILSALFLLSAPAAFANLSMGEQEDLIQCAQQFKLIQASEIGEETGIELKSSEKSVRVFRLVQAGQTRGYLQIDAQSDISQVSESGKFIQMCQ